MRRLLISTIISLVLFFVSLAIFTSSAQAQVYNPISPTMLENEITYWSEKGASAFIVWQYSGDRGTGQEFENDKYSFFRNIEPGISICQKMQEKAGGAMKLGVNVWSAGDPKNSTAKLIDHFTYLKNNCGVSVIRVFAKAGGVDGVTKVLDAANATGVQVIIAVGDYSNGGGGMPQAAPKSWYAGGYNSPVGGITYSQFASEIAAVASTKRGAVYGIELANEPHCGGDPSILPDYINWARAMGNIFKAQGLKVGLGQMASQNTTRCDSPGFEDFVQSNTQSGMQMASGHYYNGPEREVVTTALEKNPTSEFYIGEVGWGGAENITRDQYYLYPIKGLGNKATNTAANRAEIFNDLLDQGYEVQCTTPKFEVQASLGDSFQKFIQQFGEGAATFNLGSTQTYDVTQTQVPLWRREGSSSMVKSSFETYFGFQDTSSDVIKNTVNSSPLYSYLTLTEQCQQKLAILKTIGNMCSRLDDPTKCALYRTIPESSYTTETLLAAWQASGLSCAQLETDYLPTYPMNEAEFEDLRSGVLNTPLYLDKAYRVAFLVVAGELRTDEKSNGFFNFLTATNQSANPKDEVRVLAFKIPDIGTNKPNGELNYRDPLQLTRDAITTPQEQSRITQIIEAARNRLKNAVPSLEDPPIECSGQSCQDPMAQALIEMINRNGQRCDAVKADLTYEPATQITDSGTLDSGPGRIFKEELDLVGNLFSEPESQAQPQLTEFNFLSRVRVQSQRGDDKTPFRTYLIYPYGTELATVEEAILGQFFTPELIAEFEANPPEDYQEYLKLSGINQQFSNPRGEQRFPVPCNTTTNPDCTDLVSAELGSDQNDVEPRIVGGRLGFILRQVQENLHTFNSTVYNFVSSCLTTEDYFLGKCLGGSEGTAPVVGGSDNLRPVAQCQAGSPRITSGEGAKHIYIDSSQTCSRFDATIHDIPNWKNPNDPVKDCNTLFSYVACTYPNTLIQNPVTLAGQFTTSSQLTACKYVVEEAKKAGISPRFALAMWGEESGFSHYRVPDFGVISAPAQNLQLQVTAFLNTANGQSDYLAFLERYSGDTDNKFCRNKFFPARMREFYDYLGP